MKSIIPFVLGVLLTCFAAYFGGSNYVSGITKQYKDSIRIERAKNALQLDSLTLEIDSLNNRKVKNDTLIRNIYINEKTSINSADTLHSDSLKSAIIDMLRF